MRHPGVVTIYDADQIGTIVGLCMEMISGRTLEARIAQEGALDVAETVDIGVRLCGALSAVHTAGLLHRDIKASNVMIADDGRIVLMDFGAGRELESADEHPKHAPGSPLYLAPEVLKGQNATVRSDVYSLGVLLYRAFTRSYPVRARSLADLRVAHDQRHADESFTVRIERPDIPPRLAEVIDRAIDSQPERRFESAEAMGRALDSIKSPGGRRSVLRAIVPAIIGVALAAALWGANARRTTLPTSKPIRLAVLPFSVDTSSEDDGHLGAGLTEDLRARLARFENVRIISKSSAVSAAAMSLTIPEIGARLGVDAVVTGRLKATGNDLTVTARVIRVADAREMWSAEYVRASAERLVLQQEIAAAVAGHLGLRTGAQAAKWPTRDPYAYALYVRGRAAFENFSPAGRQQALRLYEEALARDPAFAQAHAAVAEVYLNRPIVVPNISGEQAMQRASEAVQRAMRLDETLPEAHIASAALSTARADFDAAERSLRRAIQLDPSSTLGHQEFAHWLSLLGRFEEALEEARTTQLLDPLSPRAIIAIGSVLRFARRYDEGLLYSDRALDLDPTFSAAILNRAHCLQGLGRLTEAIEAYQKLGRPSGNLGHALAVAGRTGEAREMLGTFERIHAETGHYAGHIAQILIGLGEHDRAVEWLERAEREEPGGPSTYKVAAVWDPLRTHPGFIELLKKWKLDR